MNLQKKPRGIFYFVLFSRIYQKIIPVYGKLLKQIELYYIVIFYKYFQFLTNVKGKTRIILLDTSMVARVALVARNIYGRRVEVLKY